jgi:Peptidase family M1 domain
MHRTIVLITLLAFLFTACGKPFTDLDLEIAPNWPAVEAVASYELDVTLDTEHKSLTGHERVTYVNTSQTSFQDAIFHLYLNAFRDDHSSIFMQEAGPSHRGFSWNQDHPGWIKVTSVQLHDGTPLSLELIEDETLGRLELPSPIAPGKALVLDIDFEAQLPQVFARTGFYEDFFMVGQWFPKLGVWQNDRWNAYPFHANSEFFADFGDYDVRITVPEPYLLAATGLPVSTQANGDGTQTTQFEAKGVIDFAWAASPHFEQRTRKVDGTEIDYVYLPEHQFTVDRVLFAAEATLSHFNDWYGKYPYPRLTILDVPDKAGGAGGMEYPMLVNAGLADVTGLGIMPGRFDRLLEAVTIHEIAHEWWYAVVAFNEAEEPWLDEGLTDYSTVRLLDKVYGSDDIVVQLGGIKLDYLQMRRLDYLAHPLVPMYGKAWDFDPYSYGIAAYSKPILALSTLENVLGEETMLKIMHTFFEQYKFSHPTTQDLRSVAESIAGQELDWFFDGLVYGDDVLNYKIKKLDEHSITVQRQGNLIIPTEVEITFEDGSTETTLWDAAQEEVKFDYSDHAPIRQAEIDPRHKILVDLQWSDNGLSRRMDALSWLGVNVRILYRMQDFLLGGGGL